MGYGSVPTLKEFDKDGNVVLTVRWGEAEDVQSYRDYKAAWVGKPTSKPDVFACKEGNGTRVYMSWNGATEHKSWSLFGGAKNGTLSEVARVERSGFETSAYVAHSLEFVRVEASGEGIDTGVSEVVSIVEAC